MSLARFVAQLCEQMKKTVVFKTYKWHELLGFVNSFMSNKYMMCCCG